MRMTRSSIDRPHVIVLYESDSIWTPQAQVQVDKYAQAILRGLANAGYQTVPVQIESPNELDAVLKPFDPSKWLVFNWFEEGHDGLEVAQVAAQLYNLGYTYTGTDALTLQLTMDKIRTEQVLTAWDVPTPEWHAVSNDGLAEWRRYPAIIKVANDHGSEFLTSASVVHDAASLYHRVNEIEKSCSNPLMVSEFIDGPEMTVSLWGNQTVECLPILQVDFSAWPSAMPRVRTYESKWDEASVAGKGIRVVPATHLGSELAQRIEQVASQAYRACGLRDYGRIDIRMHGGVPMVIDVNSNPDITADSSFVIAAKAAGFDYAALLDRIVQLALQRAENE